MNHKIYSYYLLILFLGCTMLSESQVLKFENLSMADGLSSSTIYSINQDKYGFIWIGTDNGLNIYNGVDFRHFFVETANDHSLPGNIINDILIEGDTAWIATQSGFCWMNVVSKKCTRIDLGNNNHIRTLLLDSLNRVLWVGTKTGLIKYDINSRDYQEFNTQNSNLSSNIIRSLYKDKDENLWIGTFDKLNRLTPSSTVFESYSIKNDVPINIKNNLVLSIKPIDNLNDSLLWIGTQTGLVLFNRMTHRKKNFLNENSGMENNVIKCIHIAKNEHTWLGTDFGLVELNKNKIYSIHFHNPYNRFSIANSVVWDIFEDRSGTIWFGTENGVSMLSSSTDQFVFYPMVFDVQNAKTGYDINGIIEDNNEQLWMATQKGFIQYNIKTNTLRHYNAELPLFNDTKSIFEDKKGRMWVATNGGITVLNRKTNEINNFSADYTQGDGLRTNYITSFLVDPQGNILINTLKGLHKVDERNERISFKFICDMNFLGSGKDYLWTINNSELIKINPETYKTEIVIINSINEENIDFNSLLIDSVNSKIWLGYENGILEYNMQTEGVQRYVLHSNNKYPLINLLKDTEGNLWASSYSAIIKFTTKTNEFDIYPSGEDISINLFSPNSSFVTKSGNLLFGGQDGFIMFNPASISKSDYKAPVVLTKLILASNEILPSTKIENKQVIDKEISFVDEIVLDYIEGSLVIEFSSLDYVGRKGIIYKYMLVGEDNDWNYIDNPIGRATYPRLMAGDYLLRVRGTNSDGVWMDEETTLKIKIKPPLWASNIFILGYLLILTLIIGILIYFNRNRIRMRNQMKIIRLEKQYSDETARNRQQFFTNVAHEFRTPLNLIVGPLQKLLNNKTLDENGKALVHLIEGNARRLLWLNNQFLDLRKVENKTMTLSISEFDIISFLQSIYLLFKDQAEQQNIKYGFNHEVNNLMVKMDLRKVETIVFNLLSNAFKFTDDNGEININVTTKDVGIDSRIIIAIKDSGIGIIEENQQKIFDRFYQSKDKGHNKKGLGIGLHMVNEYVVMHKGQISLISSANEGAEFQVSLPINEHFVIEEVSHEKENVKPIIKTIKELPYKLENYAPDTPFILLVEDDREMAEFIQMSLMQNYKVAVASNGVDALQLVAKNKPDLIISDLDMPKMNGVELVRKIKNNPKTAHIPIIIVSGQSQKESQMAALKEGADAYIIKPFEIELLEIRIENFLKRREQLSELIKINNISKPKEIKVSSQNEKIMEKVVVCIEKYISDPDLNVEKVCDESGFSHTFLYRKIKSLTGQTLNEFIRTVRLRRAEQLLRTKKLSVTEVMMETGFSNHSYFSKCFKKIYNFSPKDYIENH